MPLATVDWISASDQQAAQASSPGQTKGDVCLHLGRVFLDKKKLCSLTTELVGPPSRNSSDEVHLRLVGGRCATFTFQGQAQAAEDFYNNCQTAWRKEANKQGKAASVARKLEEMSKAAQEGLLNRGRSRSRSNEGPSRKKLLRRLSSVEAEGVYRVHHAQELSQERQQLEESQEHHIVVEHLRRTTMSRSEFVQSLRKEAAMHAKVVELRQSERESRDRFESLQREEATLHTSLQGLEDEVEGEHTDVVSPCKTPPSELVTSGDSSAARDSEAVSERRCECVVCFNALRCTVFLPCKHLVCCEGCGQGPSMQRCPMCRAKIDWRFKVFL